MMDKATFDALDAIAERHSRKADTNYITAAVNRDRNASTFWNGYHRALQTLREEFLMEYERVNGPYPHEGGGR